MTCQTLWIVIEKRILQSFEEEVCRLLLIGILTEKREVKIKNNNKEEKFYKKKV